MFYFLAFSIFYRIPIFQLLDLLDWSSKFLTFSLLFSIFLTFCSIFWEIFSISSFNSLLIYIFLIKFLISNCLFFLLCMSILCSTLFLFVFLLFLFFKFSSSSYVSPLSFSNCFVMVPIFRFRC